MLPGGAIEGDRDDYAARLRRRYPFLTESLARHYARTYGSNSELLLGNAGAISDLGEDFGHEFYEAELKYLVDHEWVPPHRRCPVASHKTRHVAECGSTISCESVAGGIYAAELSLAS
ncbi:aerobic glycerol-3-phosphate dehydrogenase [Escherichia coli]|uniref:glycerol-3-phosphate dehydrogenase n=1 Tax=Escherichia coli TaxID=562 RepID=A0A2X3LQ11_ECOLX|nr:aerobic glycerol-3-phosphate dehydrogenase [Escherichia coli]